MERTPTGEQKRPLAGVRVLDLTQVLAGPYCTRLLADAGADVIKIEPPRGDPSRHLPPVIAENHSGYFAWLNCGKRSVVADLSSAPGRELVRALAGEADVLVENMRPGSLDAKGLGYRELSALNPGLIMCSISAFGSVGPLAGRAGQGIIAEAMAGVIDMNGEIDGRPLPLSIALADVSAGVHAYAAIVTALFARSTGACGGDYIDMCLYQAALPFHETALEEVKLSHGQVSPTRNGPEHRQVVPYGVYDAPDGSFVLAAGTEPLWRRLDALICGELGPVTVDLSNNDKRVAARQVVRERIEAWAGAHGSVRTVLDALREAGIPSGPIVSARDVPYSDLSVALKSFVTVPDPVMGEIPVLNTPYRTLNNRIGPAGGPPRLGQDTDSVRDNLFGAAS